MIRALPYAVRKHLRTRLPVAVKSRIQRMIRDWPDHLLISFPKCGRTWLRQLIARSVYNQFPPHPASEDGYLDLAALHERCTQVPRLALSHDDCLHKCPSELERDKHKYQDTHVIFLARDPRDVIVSWYFQLHHRPATTDGSRDRAALHDLLVADRNGLATVVEFYNIWQREAKTPRSFHLVRYEDLHRDTVGTLVNLFGFLGCGQVISVEAIMDAVQYNQFEKMRAREQNGVYSHSALELRQGGPNAMKTRRGKVGGYRDYFHVADVEFMDTYICQNLHPSYDYSTPPDHGQADGAARLD
jgi:hypothetical protein